MNLFNLIPKQYTAAAKIIGVILVIAACFAAGWTVKGWNDEVAYKALQNDQLATEKKRADDALAAQKQAEKERDAAQQRVNDWESKYHADISKARTENDRLRVADRDGRVRMFIPAKCVGSAGGGTNPDPAVNLAGEGAELTGSARQAYLDLREAIIEEQTKTKALQKIAQECAKSR